MMPNTQRQALCDEVDRLWDEILQADMSAPWLRPSLNQKLDRAVEELIAFDHANPLPEEVSP